MKFHCTFDFVNNKDYEIFQLSEHQAFTIVSYGQKYLFRNDIVLKSANIETLKYNCQAKEKKRRLTLFLFFFLKK